MPHAPVKRTLVPEPPPWAAEMTTVGVTGTNGKTSTVRLCANALMPLGAVPQTTTLGSFVDNEPLEVSRNLRGFIDTMRAGYDRGGRHAVIELTSEVLGRGFARAWPCRVGVFTNLTRDHLDSHGSAEHYLASKAQLFMHLPPGGTAVLNGCDPAGALLAEVVGPEVEIVWYGTRSRGPAHTALHVAVGQTELTWEGTRFTLVGDEPNLPADLTVSTIGEVFAENALAAFLGAVRAGASPARARAGLAACPRPPGRFEPVGEGRPRVVVDYAHTPDALARTLATARRLTEGEVWVVFGAGGDRDQPKRPQLGEAAVAADRVVLTSDNPRSESPAAIADAIEEGIGGRARVERELDRRLAIHRAIAEAGERDVVVLAGRGHETEQVVGAESRRLSDREVAEEALAARRPA